MQFSMQKQLENMLLLRGLKKPIPRATVGLRPITIVIEREMAQNPEATEINRLNAKQFAYLSQRFQGERLHTTNVSVVWPLLFLVNSNQIWLNTEIDLDHRMISVHGSHDNEASMRLLQQSLGASLLETHVDL